jgi:hypothetical protein
MAKKLDPKVQAMLPRIYTREDLEYAKGVVSGDIKVTYFKAKDIPEKKPTPEAFKKQHKAKTKVKAKQKRLKRIPSQYNHKHMLETITVSLTVGYSRQEVIQTLVETFGVSKHSAGYHHDKFVGKR